MSGAASLLQLALLVNLGLIRSGRRSLGTRFHESTSEHLIRRLAEPFSAGVLRGEVKPWDGKIERRKEPRVERDRYCELPCVDHEECDMEPCVLSGTDLCGGCGWPDCPSQVCEARREAAYQRQEEGKIE